MLLARPQIKIALMDPCIIFDRTLYGEIEEGMLQTPGNFKIKSTKCIHSEKSKSLGAELAKVSESNDSVSSNPSSSGFNSSIERQLSPFLRTLFRIIRFGSLYHFVNQKRCFGCFIKRILLRYYRETGVRCALRLLICSCQGGCSRLAGPGNGWLFIARDWLPVTF